MQIKDIMIRDVRYVGPDTAVADIARLMRDCNCGAVPVADEGRLIGMVTDRDIVLRCVAEDLDCGGMTAEQCMSPGILYCHDSDTVEDVLTNMGEQAVKRLPVIDADKRLVGIVSFGDLSAACPDKAVSGRAMDQIRRTHPDPFHVGHTHIMQAAFWRVDGGGAASNA